MTQTEAKEIAKYRKEAAKCRKLMKVKVLSDPRIWGNVAAIWDAKARWALGLRDTDYNFG